MAYCLQALVDSGETDLHLVARTAYGRSAGKRSTALDGIDRKTAAQALAELTTALTNKGRDTEDIGVLSTDTGVYFRVTVMPAAQQAVLRRVPTAIASG